MKTIVVGIGNPILRDDGVGIHIIKRFRELTEGLDVTIEEAATGGMNLLDLILGYDRAVLVDAVTIQEMELGEVVVIREVEKMETAHSTNPHDTSFPEAIEVARKMGEKRVPEEILLVGINIRPIYEFGEGLSREVELAVPIALEELNRLV
ncbi:MAG: hydrogenase maturation protease [Thermoplasmatota archaeon]